MDRPDPTLFVVDNSPAARESLALLASSLGIACQAFSSAEEFLQHFDPSRCGCAVVVNLQLEGMSGLELQGRLADAGSAVPVILLGQRVGVREVVAAMQNGAMAVLEKPYRPEELAENIAAAIDKSREIHAARRKQQQLQSRLESLTARENEVLELILQGRPNKTIARQLDVSQRTVDRVRAELFAKLGVESAVGASRMVVTVAPQLLPA